MQGLPPPVDGGFAPQAVGESNSPVATAACQNYQLFEWYTEGICKIQLPDIHPPLGGSKKCPWAMGWPPVAIGLSDSPTARGHTHRPRPMGAPAGGRGGFRYRYKSSSLLRPHIADTSALPT